MKVCLFLLLCTLDLMASAVTYGFSGGRFGDNVLTYLHAKWISYQFGIPLAYRSFPYSSELMMHVFENQLPETRKYREIDISSFYPGKLNKDEDILYVCPYFPESTWELTRKHSYFVFPVNWSDKEFREIALQMIAPQQNLNLIHPPTDSFNIAMHVRQAGNFDDYEHFFKHPAKTPPVSYFSDCLQKIIAILPPGQFIYCHIFTDDENPQRIVDELRGSVSCNVPISFGFRTNDNRHDANVLEDFFSLFHFDALVRAESNYSIVPDLLHDYSIVSFPLNFVIQDRVVTITDIDFKVDEMLLKECLASKSCR